MLHRFPTGLSGEKVHQKRVPAGAPPWLETVRVHFPRYGLHADELCVVELADVIWAVQMSTVEFHPWNSRRADVERPDEWRIDLDPMPACPLATVRRIAHVVHELLDELGAVGWPKTSGGKGMHVYVRIEPAFGFRDVRRAALAFAREVERRAPDAVTTTWWRKDRDPSALFVDFNQNARDHTMAFWLKSTNRADDPGPCATTSSSRRRAPARPRGRRPARRGGRPGTRTPARCGRRRASPCRRRSSASPLRRARRAARGPRGDPTHRGQRARRHGIEVDAPFVGPLDVGAARVPRMELDGRHLHRPDHVRQLDHAQLVGVEPVAGEVDPHGLQPRPRTSPDPVLVNVLAADPVREAVPRAGKTSAIVDRSRFEFRAGGREISAVSVCRTCPLTNVHQAEPSTQPPLTSAVEEQLDHNNIPTPAARPQPLEQSSTGTTRHRVAVQPH